MDRIKEQARSGLSRLLARRFWAVVKTYDVSYAEVQTAGLAILWGAWVASPFWNALSHMPAHRLLPHMTNGSEWVWGVAALLIGILHFAGMYFDAPEFAFITDRLPPGSVTTWRRTMTMLNFALWVFITLAYLQVEWRSAVWWLYAFFAISSLRSYAKIVEAGMGDGQRYLESDHNGSGDASGEFGCSSDRGLDKDTQRQAIGRRHADSQGTA